VKNVLVFDHFNGALPQIALGGEVKCGAHFELTLVKHQA
jgi:hypothetical protein